MIYEQKLSEWSDIQCTLFPNGVPSNASWADINDIKSVLNTICKYSSCNHMLLPDCGGMDLCSVTFAQEHDCLELHTPIVYIVKPKQLTFKSFGVNDSRNYFLLEVDNLPIINFEDGVTLKDFNQQLTEVTPGEYEPFSGDFTYYHEQGYKNARSILRWLKGKFLIVSKYSAYNHDKATYDARHNSMSNDQLRNYIESNYK